MVTTASTEKLSRREREKIRHRGEILAAGLELFSERGFHSVTMQEIARHAEFSIGTLYNFFKNKEELYRAIMHDHAETFEESLLGALDEGEDEYERMLNYARVKGEAYMDRIKVVRLYFAETRGASFNLRGGLDEELRESYERIIRKLTDVFASGIEAGVFHRLDPYYLAVAIDGLTRSLLFLWMDDPEKHPYESRFREMMKAFFGPVKIGPVDGK